MKLVSVIQISDSEWDELVIKTYGKPYCFQQQDDCKPRGIHGLTVPFNPADDFKNNKLPFKINGSKMGVSFQAWKNCTHKYQKIFWERNFYPHLQMVANDLYAQGIIQAGEYQIEIDW